MRLRRRSTTLVTAGFAVLLLAGCGGSDDGGSDAAASTTAASSSASEQTGSEVAAAAADALEEAGAAHVSGTIGAGAEAQTVDVFLQGDDATGSLSIGGQQIQLVTVDGVSYFQAPAEFWTSSGVPAEAVAGLVGVWVVVPPEEAAAFQQLSLAGLAEELRNPTDGAVEDEVATEELDGTEVLVVTQADGSKLYVAAEEPSYPLQIVNEGDEAGTLTLDRFGEQQEITAPAGALDLSQVGA